MRREGTGGGERRVDGKEEVLGSARRRGQAHGREWSERMGRKEGETARGRMTERKEI